MLIQDQHKVGHWARTIVQIGQVLPQVMEWVR